MKPLGWDWRIGSATIASFPAREVIVSTMGVIFGLGGDVDEANPSLREKLAAATWDGSDRPIVHAPGCPFGDGVFCVVCPVRVYFGGD